MRKRLFNWRGERFLHLWLEGRSELPLPDQASDLFVRAGQELAIRDLSLVRNVVRTHIFGRTAAARAAGSEARLAALVGRSRAAGSSYISNEHFGSAAEVALELFAMAGPYGHPVRHVAEHEPEQSFIRHLTWGHMVFLAGMTCDTKPNVAGQCADILPRASTLLTETGCTFEDVVKVSFFLEREQEAEELLRIVAELCPLPLGDAEIEFVEGFSRPGKLVEIEITARRP